MLQPASANEADLSAPVTFASVRGRPASAIAPSIVSYLAPASGGGPAADSRVVGENGRNHDPLALLSSLPGAAPLVVLGEVGGPSTSFFRLARHLLRSDRALLLLGGRSLGLFSPGARELRGKKVPSALVLDRDDLALLTGMAGSNVRRDELPLVQDWAGELESIVVLRGAPFLIAMPDRRVFLNPGRVPEQELPGEEQVLMGTIAAMYDLGASLEDAVRSGVSLVSAVRDRFPFPEPRDSGPQGLLERLSEASTFFLHDHEVFLDRFVTPIEII